MLSNASSARLVDREGGGTVSDRRLFQTQSVFRAGSAVVVYLDWQNGQEMSSPLSEDDLKWNAHEDCAAGDGGCGQFVVVELRSRR